MWKKTQQMTINPKVKPIEKNEQLDYDENGRIKCNMCTKTLVNLKGYNTHRSTTHKNQFANEKITIEDHELIKCDEYK